MMLKGESIHSPLPFDLPWWMPDHFIFFSVLYLVLAFLGGGLVFTIIKSYFDAKKHGDQH